jgi:hypothetical protein
VTRNKVKEMYYFAKLLNCKSYGDILELKKTIDSDMYKIITDMYERLYQDYDYDVIVEEKTIDLEKLDLDNIDTELKDIIRILLSTSIDSLEKVKIESNNSYVKEIYNDSFKLLDKQKLTYNKPNYLNIKITTVLK